MPGRIDSTRSGWVELAGIGPARVAIRDPAPTGDVVLMIRPERLRLLAPGQTADGATETSAAFYAFDLIEVNSFDLRRDRIEERKRALAHLLRA